MVTVTVTREFELEFGRLSNIRRLFYIGLDAKNKDKNKLE